MTYTILDLSTGFNPCKYDFTNKIAAQQWIGIYCFYNSRKLYQFEVIEVEDASQTRQEKEC